MKAVGVGEERGKREEEEEERTAVATFVIYDPRYSLSSPHRLRRAHTRHNPIKAALSLSLLPLSLSRHPFTRFPSTLLILSPLRGLTSVSPEQGEAGGEMCTREMRSGRCRCYIIIGRANPTTRDKRRWPALLGLPRGTRQKPLLLHRDL